MYNSTLDLAITNRPQIVSNFVVLSDTPLKSDHHPIKVELVCECKIPINPHFIAPPHDRITPDNWSKFTTQLESLATQPDSPKSVSDIEKLWSKIRSSILLAASIYVGHKSRNKICKPWNCTPTIISAERHFRTAKKAYQSNPTPSNKTRMELREQPLQCIYRNTKNNEWRNFSNRIQNGKFVNWNIFNRSIPKEPSSMSNFADEQDNLPNNLLESLNNAAPAACWPE